LAPLVATLINHRHGSEINYLGQDRNRNYTTSDVPEAFDQQAIG